MEKYSTLALSTGHLKPEDIETLTQRAGSRDENMMFQRDTGFFIKLYDDGELNSSPDFSTDLNLFLAMAVSKGYRMVEFDGDAEYLSGYPEHFGNSPEQEYEDLREEAMVLRNLIDDLVESGGHKVHADYLRFVTDFTTGGYDVRRMLVQSFKASRPACTKFYK